MFHGQIATFWRLSFFNSKYLLAPSKAGLISNRVPTSPASTAGGGDSPSYSGFFHCLAAFDDRSSPCLTQASVYRARNPFFHGSFIPCNFGSFHATTCQLVYFNSETLSSSFHVKVHRYYILNTTKSPFCSIKLITLCSISWIPFVYLLEHPSTPTSGTLPTEQQHNRYFVSTPFISSTHHCLSLLIAFNTLFYLDSLCFSYSVDTIHL